MGRIDIVGTQEVNHRWKRFFPGKLWAARRNSGWPCALPHAPFLSLPLSPRPALQEAGELTAWPWQCAPGS